MPGADKANCAEDFVNELHAMNASLVRVGSRSPLSLVGQVVRRAYALGGPLTAFALPGRRASAPPKLAASPMIPCAKTLQ